jgi:hypothetical protein
MVARIFRHREAEASHDPLVRDALESIRFRPDARIGHPRRMDRTSPQSEAFRAGFQA